VARQQLDRRLVRACVARGHGEHLGRGIEGEDASRRAHAPGEVRESTSRSRSPRQHRLARRQGQRIDRAQPDAVDEARAPVVARRQLAIVLEGFAESARLTGRRAPGATPRTASVRPAEEVAVRRAMCEEGVAHEPPRRTYCPHMNLPLYSPTAPAAGTKPGYGP